MAAAIDAVPYRPRVKIGLQFKRRFWEQDEAIYGGITYTDLPISPDLLSQHAATAAPARAVLLGAYAFGPTGLRIHVAAARGARRRRVELGRADPSAIQDRVRERRLGRLAPGALGARLLRHVDRARRAPQHYGNLCEIDGRILLAGEHASYMPAWQEGAILSALDAISRLHRRVVSG